MIRRLPDGSWTDPSLEAARRAGEAASRPDPNRTRSAIRAAAFRAGSSLVMFGKGAVAIPARPLPIINRATFTALAWRGVLVNAMLWSCVIMRG